MTNQPLPDEGYCSLKTAEWCIILTRESVGFRFGPYTEAEAGEIAEQCQLEGIPFLLSATCGRDFDWDLARDFARGNPADWQTMEDAPFIRPIIAEVNSIETLITWFGEWQVWREIETTGKLGQPIAHPTRWRELTDAEAAELEAVFPVPAAPDESNFALREGPNGTEWGEPLPTRVAQPDLVALGLDDPEGRN